MSVKRIAVVGAGIMGRGIAYASAIVGYDTVLFDVKADALAAAREDIESITKKGVERGKVDARAAESMRVITTTDLAEACNGSQLVIEAARDQTSGSLKEYTVLSTQVDPYRLDTPANHEIGKWFAGQMDRLDLLHRQLHLRGIHYALLGSTTMPSGRPYTNTGENWVWLQESAAKAARWLGYISFDAITDARNEEPVIWIRGNQSVTTWVSVEPDITFPDLGNIRPHIGMDGFEGRQPYRLCLIRREGVASAGTRPNRRPFQGGPVFADGRDL